VRGARRKSAGGTARSGSEPRVSGGKRRSGDADFVLAGGARAEPSHPRPNKITSRAAAPYSCARDGRRMAETRHPGSGISGARFTTARPARPDAPKENAMPSARNPAALASEFCEVAPFSNQFDKKNVTGAYRVRRFPNRKDKEGHAPASCPRTERRLPRGQTVSRPRNGLLDSAFENIPVQSCGSRARRGTKQSFHCGRKTEARSVTIKRVSLLNSAQTL
jgi:hypothetical protein